VHNAPEFFNDLYHRFLLTTVPSMKVSSLARSRDACARVELAHVWGGAVVRTQCGRRHAGGGKGNLGCVPPRLHLYVCGISRSLYARGRQYLPTLTSPTAR
jgi:hypothetical protein